MIVSKREPADHSSAQRLGESAEERDASADNRGKRTLLLVKRSCRRPVRRLLCRRQRIERREPTFTKNRRGRFLCVKLAFDRSSRLLADVTYRFMVARCRRGGQEPAIGLRAAHRFFWRIQMRRAFSETVFKNLAGKRRRRRWFRLAEWLERDARINRDRNEFSFAELF
jgi:hypothetical protein